MKKYLKELTTCLGVLFAIALSTLGAFILLAITVKAFETNYYLGLAMILIDTITAYTIHYILKEE